MKIICPVKFTPDTDSLVFDYSTQELNREECKQIINPDDACAMGLALKLKKQHPGIEIEVLTMAPLSIFHSAEDIARRGIDRVTILNDPHFAGSDTLATGRVLQAYLKEQRFDVILTGSRSLDGDTGHVPSQIAAFLGLPCMTGIVRVDEDSFLEGHPAVEVETETDTFVYEVPMPAVLGIAAKSGYRLPFVRYADLDLDVSDRVAVFGSLELGLDPKSAGPSGSATKVVRTYTEVYQEKQRRIFVKNDEEGVETVYRFLKGNGYLT